MERKIVAGFVQMEILKSGHPPVPMAKPPAGGTPGDNAGRFQHSLSDIQNPFPSS
jgi:hypothetical protein